MHRGGSLEGHVSFHSRSHQSKRIREQFLGETSIDHLVQPPLPNLSHEEPIAQDHVHVSLEHLQGGTLDNLKRSATEISQPPTITKDKVRGQIIALMAQVMVL